MENNKNVQKVSKEELMKNIASTSGMDFCTVKKCIESLENVIITMLRDTNFDKDVSIKLFDGFYIDSTYITGTRRKNNLTGKLIDVSDKIKIKARILRGYKEKINQ